MKMCSLAEEGTCMMAPCGEVKVHVETFLLRSCAACDAEEVCYFEKDGGMWRRVTRRMLLCYFFNLRKLHGMRCRTWCRRKRANFFGGSFAGSGGAALVPLAGRTREGLLNLVQRLKDNPGGVHGLAGPLRSLSNTVFSNVATHSLRGVIFPDGDVVWGRLLPPKAPAVWFAFSGRYFFFRVLR